MWAECHRSLVEPRCAAQVTDPYNELWQADWVVSNLWHVLNWMVLAVACRLFGPTQQALHCAIQVQGAPLAGATHIERDVLCA